MARPRLAPGETGEVWTSAKKNAKGLYEARVFYADLSGDRKQCRVERPTKGQARADVLARVEKLLGRGADRPSEPVTVERAVWDWLASRPSKEADIRRGISPQTRAGYSEVIRRAVAPGIGAIALGDLTARRIQDFLDGLVVDGTRYTEARHALTIVRQALRYAELGDLIQGNPAMACEAPAKIRSKPRALTDRELEAVRRAAQDWQDGGATFGIQRSEHLVDVLDVMLGLGVRIGEALALRWSDIDLERGLVHVRGTLVEVRAYRTEAGEHIQGQFFRQDWRKSGIQAEELVVEAPRFVLEVLGRRMIDSPRLNPVDAVFVSRAGTFLHPSRVRTQFRNAKEAAGLKVELDWAVPHKLRATALTEVSKAVGVEEAARLGGHSSHQITQRYYVDPGPAQPVRQADVLERFAPRTN